MITKDELEYKVDEVSVIRKDIVEIEGKLKVILSSNSEDSKRTRSQIRILKRYRATLIVYLDDLNGEIADMQESLGTDVEMTKDELENALSENDGQIQDNETNLERALFGQNDNSRTTERTEEESGDIYGSGEGHSDQGLPSTDEGIPETSPEEKEMPG